MIVENFKLRKLMIKLNLYYFSDTIFLRPFEAGHYLHPSMLIRPSHSVLNYDMTEQIAANWHTTLQYKRHVSFDF